MCSVDCFLVLLALLFPPLPVWVKRGICSADSFINIALCCLGVLPGLLHAWYIISKYPDPFRREYMVIGDGERSVDGISTRSYSSRGPQQHDRTVYTIPAPRDDRAQPGRNAGYGSTQQQQQQQSAAGPSSGTGHGAPPSYASVVAGDNKVQH